MYGNSAVVYDEVDEVYGDEGLGVEAACVLFSLVRESELFYVRYSNTTVLPQNLQYCF